MKKLVLLLAVVIPTLCFGGEGTYRFSRLSIEEGLSNPTVNDILFDSRGVVWMATKEGLNSFDGKRVRVFRPNTGAEDSEVGLQVAKIVGTGADTLFLVLPDYLSIFEIKSGRFTNIPFKDIV